MKYLFTIAALAGFILFGLFSQPALAYGETYVVQPGDTLFTIANHYGLSVNDLARANNLTNGYWLYAGQQLIIPTPSPFFEPAPLANPAFVPRFVSFAPPTMPAPPSWQAQNWSPYPEQPPAFYQPAPAYGYPGWSRWSNPATERWIDVDLSRQVLTAYEGRRSVFRTLVSSGLPQFPTVAGTFSIYVKYESADMSGGAGDDEYFLPAVPYVMYFYGNYGLHGTYWHHNFGQPMSHGCVNLYTPDAEWLFNWASVGTRVVTHY